MNKQQPKVSAPVLEVGPSQLPFANRGLFTRSAIPKDATIVEYTGRISSWADCNQMGGDNNYLYYIDEEHVIDASREDDSLGRYANDAHGLKRVRGLLNNARFVEEGYRVYIVATRDIRKGEEIFVSYGKEYWDVIRSNMAIDKAEAKVKEKK